MEKIKRKIGKWSKQEDELLLNGVQRYGARDWPKISTLVMGRNSVRTRVSRLLSLFFPERSRTVNTYTHRNNVEIVGRIISIRVSRQILGQPRRIT